MAATTNIPQPASTFNFDKWFPWIVALFGLLLYINTVNFHYVLDDDTVLAKNSIVTKGISAIPKIMTTPYRKGAWDRQESLYRPLSLVMFAVEWQIAPNRPFLGHLINILLYTLTGFVLYKLLRKWFRQKHPFIAFCIALLFIAHPLHTEVIANIKSRDEILGLLFGILSLSNMYDYATKNSIKNLVACILFFFFSLLSKEGSITLLAIIPLSIYFFCDAQVLKKYAVIIGGLFVSFLCYFIMRRIALGSIVNFQQIELLNNSLMASDNPIDRFATAIIFTGYYLRLFFFPHPLSFDYSFNTIPIASLSDPRFLGVASLLILLIFYAIKNIKRKDPVAFGILFFGVTLSIVSNIFILIEATIAERFLYLPSLGLCISLILLADRWIQFPTKNNLPISILIKQNKIFSSCLLIVLLLFSAKTITRNFDWKDNMNLFGADKDHNPDSYRTISAYPIELYKQKIYPLKDNDPQKQIYCKEAIDYLNKSIAITPDHFKVWNILAYCYIQLKDYQHAQYAFENGVKYHKNEADWISFHIIGINAYFYQKNYTKSIEVTKEALKIDPKNATLWSCLGMNLVEINDNKNAADALSKSIQLDSTQVDAFYNFGNLYAKGGDYTTAITYYAKALERDADNINALNNTGNCYAVLKQYDKALKYYEKILKIDPNYKDAIRNISVTYANLGNKAKADEYDKRLLAIH